MNCAKCGAERPRIDCSTPDACLGWIPGVSHACCGHGNEEEAYVVIGGEPNESCTPVRPMLTLRGGLALLFFELVRQAMTDPKYPSDYVSVEAA